MKKIENDVLDWNLFLKGSNKRKKQVPKKSSLDNRLIFETKNLFVIAGLGAFVPGYFLIITKKSYTSFAQLEDIEFQEYEWVLEKLDNLITKIYGKISSVFEHGMCACAGGLDHAHVHVMPLPNENYEKKFEKGIDKVLKKRAAGISKIKFNNNEFENVHDISTIINFNSDYEITEGKLLTLNDLKNEKINFKSKRNELLLTEQYINFILYNKKINFCTNNYLGTQFGREVVYQLYMTSEAPLKEEFNQLSRSDPSRLIWRWQDYMFEKNIIQTMNDFFINSKIFFNNDDIKRFGFISHVIK